jgi:hypothetical protein
LSNGTTVALVARLRSRSAAGAIAPPTDKAGSSEIDESELVAAIELDRPLFRRSPVKAPNAASQFSAALATR